MNTIPKLKINQIKLEDSANIKHAYFQKRFKQKTKFFWNQPGEIEIAGIDLFLSSDFSSIEEFQELSNYYQKILNHNLNDLEIPIIFIGSAFDLKQKIDKSPWGDMPMGKIFIPKYLYINQKGEKNLFTIDEGDKDSQIELMQKTSPTSSMQIKNETSRENFYDMVDDSKALIKDNELEKIVISREKKYQFDFDDQAQFNFLIHAENKFPKCTTFLYDFKDSGVFFGVTPETLFKIENGMLYSEALAGTFASNSKEVSNKELKEHGFVVDYIKNQISHFSYDELSQTNPKLIDLGKMSHLKTKLKLKLKDQINPFDIIYKLHPTPAVAGFPNDIATDKISKIECHYRGWYSGPIGWIDTKYNANFKVAIRSGIANQEEICIYAGCGITEDSDAEAEYSESEMKFNSILSVLNHEQ